ncbi:UDP-2,3-diacylglucosamine diphosphatase [Persicobacter diffluens]|uniref:UDP-2,3-diacylglucosamine hydrolase n=1 Tax=Persicobacter diffluens TaxID=981 RepID=A0AAN4VUP3_9BACT|nr:UDP-2,3-diacylglucosamine hydrolase [Persicobacter diffluens]
MAKHYKTIVISDVHLGTRGSKAKELVKFLKKNSCDNLFLNGDIIDGWQLKKSGVWKKKHTRFFMRIMKMMEKHQTKVFYLRGNHDDFLDQVLPLKIGNFEIAKDYFYHSHGKRYYIIHGDIFDSITTQWTWLAKLGDIGYTFLLWLNHHYNRRRRKKGLPYYSLSQVIKARVKSAVSFIDDFEQHLVSIARHHNCNGIICGHIHQPANKMIEDIHYLNSGDWVESLTALAEDENGKWQLITYCEELMEEEEVEKKGNKEWENLLQNSEEEENTTMSSEVLPLSVHEMIKLTDKFE